MKKTLTVNLNGTVFIIDEDAYTLLDEYIRNLRIYFRKNEDSEEIVSDIEARIAELFSDRLRLGYTIVDINHVKEVIEKIGNPKDFGDTEEADTENFSSEEVKKKIKKRFYRDVDNKVFGGLCSGLANYFGWDATPLRIIMFILIFVTSFWIIPIYLVFWIFVPAAKTAEQKLEMKGEEVNLENIGKKIAEPVQQRSGVGEALVMLLKLCLIGLGILIGIPLLFAFVIILIVLFALCFGLGTVPFMDFFEFELPYSGHPALLFGILLLFLGIPLIMFIYNLLARSGKTSPLANGLKWGGLAVWFIALFALIFFGFKILNDSGKSWNKGNWTFSIGDHETNVIIPSGVLSDIQATLPAFKTLRLEDNLIANVRLEQTPDSARILINGDANLIEAVRWNVSEEGELVLSSEGMGKQGSDIIIKISAPGIEQVRIKSLGSVTADSKIQSDYFSVSIDGAGKFRADSLEIKELKTHIKGVGSISVGGKAYNADFLLDGAGKIEAFDLDADTVFAVLKGVGALECNPIDKLDASVNGVGKITYKNEPPLKDVNISGMGKVMKE